MNDAEKNRYIAETIIEQLGGGRFITMTGAKDLTILDRGVQLKINGRHPELGKKVNRVIVKLNFLDLYDVDYLYVREGKVTTIAKAEGIYNDMLMDSFEQNTGLYVTLYPRR
jgi:hypothetical protein